MTLRRLVAVVLIGTGPFGASSPLPARAADPATASRRPPLPPETVRGHCSVCHSFELVEQQRLDRANWDWVMEDMIVKYGATWIDEEFRARLVDYLVEHYGPER